MTKFKLCIMTILVIVFSYTISSTFAYWSSINLSNQDAVLVEVPIGEWGIAVGGIEGIPEYVLGETYSIGNYVWWEGKIYQIIGGGYASAPPPSTAPYGPFNEIYHEYVPTNTYYANDVVLHEGMFYRVLNAGVANSSVPGTNGAGWLNMYSIAWSTGQTYVQGSYVIHNNKIYQAVVGYNLNTNEPGTSLHWKQIGSMEWNPYLTYSKD